MAHPVHYPPHMSRPLFLVALGLAACQAQAVTDDGADIYEADRAELYCGTHEPTNAGKMSVEQQTQRMPLGDAKPGAVIDVHVHVIRKDATNGDVADTSIGDQISILNTAFRSTGFSFRLASIDRTTSATWFAMAPGSDAEKQAKFALRKGSARDLNLYTAEPGAGMVGYATFPVDFTAAPNLDGVVMLHSAMPGGASAPYNLGDQTVHQVGHWLGLYHTYQTACGDNGDLVSDTPATNAPAFGCPVGRDTCGDDDSMDPVRNYMDATDDACMNAFTDGQRQRIDRQFTAFRRY
ncbi:MAG: zinc metalloprotease [Kofleriaceae bacterium]